MFSARKFDFGAEICTVFCTNAHKTASENPALGMELMFQQPLLNGQIHTTDCFKNDTTLGSECRTPEFWSQLKADFYLSTLNGLKEC